MTQVRLLKPYRMAEVDAKAGDIVEATFHPFTDEERPFLKARARKRAGAWVVRWAHNFSTHFVDGLDAVAVEPRS